MYNNGYPVETGIQVPSQHNTIVSSRGAHFPKKTWVAVIGWFQTIFSANAIVAHAFILIASENELNLIRIVSGEMYGFGKLGGNDQALFLVFRNARTVGIYTYIVCFMGGSVLLLGLAQENRDKILHWMVLQGIFLVFLIVEIALQIQLAGYNNRLYFYTLCTYVAIVVNFFAVFGTLLFMWIVTTLISEFKGTRRVVWI